MTETADVIVVGGGLEGLSTAWQLADRGADVLVLERATLCSGGTAKSSGVVRSHYGVRSLAAMAWHGVQVLEAAGDVLGDDVGFHRTGYVVVVGEGNTAALQANVAMQAALGIETSLVPVSDVASLWPQADVSDVAAAAYEPRGGHGDAHRTGMAYAKRARELGARIRQHACVTAVRAGDGGRVGGVRLADGSEVSAGAVVVAAGPWSPPLVAPLGIDLPVHAQREQILLLDVGAPARDLPVLSDLVSLQYVRSEPSGELLLGSSDHSEPERADPDRYRDHADDAHVERAVVAFTGRFPGYADVRLVASYAGCYDVTPDYNPVLAAAPGVDGLFLAAGFSGHGYKISPAVGRLMADLVLDGESSDPDVDAADFVLERFARGRFLRSAHPYTGAGQMR